MSLYRMPESVVGPLGRKPKCVPVFTDNTRFPVRQVAWPRIDLHGGERPGHFDWTYRQTRSRLTDSVPFC